MDAFLKIADAINKDIDDILERALSGCGDDYVYRESGGRYIRWGLVQADIHRAVERNLTEGK
uniref:Uncharacterized protein n=1 Tax=viral metagenome TaxID=1070528 RepID=A0A6M3JWT1_9ZZZZ